METSILNMFADINAAAKEGARCLRKGQEWNEKSHPAACYALHIALESGDLSPLETFRAMVSDAAPRLVRAFDAWVCAMTSDNVRKVGAGYDDGGQAIKLSEYANWGIAWCCKAPIPGEKPTASKNPIDPRAAMKQLANKLQERGCKDAFAKKADRDTVQKDVMAVLARAYADIEAIHAGTYGKAAEPVAEKPATNKVAKLKVA